MKKSILAKSLILASILSGGLSIFPPLAHADMLIPFWPTSNNNILNVLAFNFIGNLLALYLVCRFYLHIQNFVKILLSSIVITLIGGFIDIFSLLLTSILFPLFSSLNKMFENFPIFSAIVVLLIFFIICFLLLWAMYFFVIKKIFKITNAKSGKKAAAILALATHPVIFLLIVFLPLFLINHNLAVKLYEFIYGTYKPYSS